MGAAQYVRRLEAEATRLGVEHDLEEEVFPGMLGRNAGKAEYWTIIGRCGKLFYELTEV